MDNYNAKTVYQAYAYWLVPETGEIIDTVSSHHTFTDIRSAVRDLQELLTTADKDGRVHTLAAIGFKFFPLDEVVDEGTVYQVFSRCVDRTVYVGAIVKEKIGSYLREARPSN
jgi:hypothetical protein